MICICTALNFSSENHYFGRNFDWVKSYGEKPILTPRKHKILFGKGNIANEHFAILGMGIKSGGYPLYFDGVNEKGLCMAGLNFPNNAVYGKEKCGMANIASYEMILWVLAQCETTEQAKTLLSDTNVTNASFSTQYWSTPLHWIISDKNGSVTAETTKEGLEVYENPVGVLTNNPPFLTQYGNIEKYLTLSPHQPQNSLAEKLNLKGYSRGMGAVGLPGDYSSQARFIRGVFVSQNAGFGKNDEECINQCFHMLSAVEVPKGCVTDKDGEEYTVYSSCINADKGVYYLKKYEDNSIIAVNMHELNLNSDKIFVYCGKSHNKYQSDDIST